MSSAIEETSAPNSAVTRCSQAMENAYRAIRFRRAASALSVIAINEGIAANGSTRKKIELNASTEKRTSGARLSSFSAIAAGLVQITSKDTIITA